MAYRWSSPRDWLFDPNGGGSMGAARVLAAVIDLVDSDQLQDLFRSEMEADGYFEPIENHSPDLYDYSTGERIRLATAEELAESLAAAEEDGGRGVFEVDGRSCYVLGHHTWR